MLMVRALDGLALGLDGEPLDPPPGRRAQELLAWLALNPGAHRRAKVAALFWPRVWDRSALGSLRQAVYELRSGLGEHGSRWLVTDRDTVGLAGDGLWVDVRAFEELVEAGRLEEAVEVGEGDLLPDFAADWVYELRDRHRDRMSETLKRLASKAEAADDAAETIRWSRKRLEVDPTSEEAARLLMSRLADVGDRPGALDTYERLCTHLDEEHEMKPSAQTQELAEAVRSGEGDRSGSPENKQSVLPPPEGGPPKTRTTKRPVEPPAPPKVGRVLAVAALAILAVTLLLVGLLGPQTCGTATELRVLTSADKEDAVRRAVDGYMRDSAETGGCRTVNVNVTAARTSGQAIKALRADWSTPALSEVGPRPDVWLPTSRVEVDQVRAGRDDSALLRIYGEGSIASTPLVLASSGVPRRPLRASEPDRLRAQLRELRTVRTNPASSTAGLLATHRLYEAAPDVEARREWERDVPVGGEDPRALLCQLRLTDQGALREDQGGLPEQSAFLVPENVLDDFNEGRPLGGPCAGTRRGPPQELKRIEIDPANSDETASTDEATPAKFDHPCVRVSPLDPAGDERKRQEASTNFCRYLRSEEGQSVLMEHGFAGPSGGRSPVDPDKVIREWEMARLRARVLLAIDVSGSMEEPLHRLSAKSGASTRRQRRQARRSSSPTGPATRWASGPSRAKAAAWSSSSQPHADTATRSETTWRT